MTKRSTTAPDTSSKHESAETSSIQTDGKQSSASCLEALVKERYIQGLKASAPRVRQLFQLARISLLLYESEAVNVLSEDFCLQDYDEMLLNRQRRCELLLGEIDLLLTGLSMRARQIDFELTQTEENNPDLWLSPDLPSETH